MVVIKGPSGTIDTGGGANDEFKAKLAGEPDEALQEMLKKGNLSPEETLAVLQALAERKGNSAGGPDAQADKEEIQELMNELKNHTLTDEGKERLAGLLGVDVKDLDKAQTAKSGGVHIKGPSGSIDT
jgi:polyhydroxyalkanoate synthesis regulator phasin